MNRLRDGHVPTQNSSGIARYEAGSHGVDRVRLGGQPLSCALVKQPIKGNAAAISQELAD
jgi:hypothetical protein